MDQDTRLDNQENNSHSFLKRAKPLISDARDRAKRNNEWASSRGMVDKQTGEVLQDKEGNTLTLAHMSKSWYSEQGARNNAFAIVKRLKRTFEFPVDVKRFRPKFITLTFANIDESWKAEKAIQKFLNDLRMWAKRKGVELLAYFWTGEVQERGALHYHILILGCPFLLKEQLSSWWSFGFVDVRAVDDMGRAFKYLAKYLWKWGKLAGEPDTLPEWWFLFSPFHKRRYGFSKWFSLPPAERVPRWLKQILIESDSMGHLEKAGRVEGGGWSLVINRPSGKVELVFDSPYKVVELSS